MIKLLAYWFYYYCLFFLIGFHFFALAGRRGRKYLLICRTYQVLLAGIVFTVSSLVVIHFFIPINQTVHTVIAGSVLVISIYRYKLISSYIHNQLKKAFCLNSKDDIKSGNHSEDRTGTVFGVSFVIVIMILYCIIRMVPYVYHVSFSAVSAGDTPVKIYWNQGEGFNEIESEEMHENVYGSHYYGRTIFSQFPINQVRFDVGTSGQIIKISNIECNNRLFAESDMVDSMLQANDLSDVQSGGGWFSYRVDGTDPHFALSVVDKGVVVSAALFRAIALVAACLICIVMLCQRDMIGQTVLVCVGMIKRNVRLLAASGIFIFLLVLIVLFVAGRVNGFPDHYDTDLYHAQTVRWIKEFPVVPGLGNLHLRLAFNNSWFLLAAFTDTFDFQNKSYHLLNSFFYIVTVGIVLARICAGLRGVMNLCTLYCMVVCIPLVLYLDGVNSLSTDVASNLLAVLVVSEVLDALERGVNPSHVLFLAALVGFGITLKLILVPFIIIPFLLLFFIHSLDSDTAPAVVTLRAALGIVTLMSLILCPWLIRGLIQTGYLFWPVPDFDLFVFDWKIPVSYIKQELLWIRSWPFNATPDVFVHYGLGHWLAGWAQQYRYIIAAVIVVICLFNFTLQQSAALAPWRRQLLMLHLAQSIAVTYWIVNAPDFRFGFGLIISYLGVMVAACLRPLTHHRYFGQVIGILVFGQFSIYTLTSIASHPLNYSELPSYAEYPIQPFRFVSGLEVQVTISPEDRCGNALIPCIPFHYKRFRVEPRGDSHADGFRVAASRTTLP